jgi:hypothetical protein
MHDRLRHSPDRDVTSTLRSVRHGRIDLHHAKPLLRMAGSVFSRGLVTDLMTVSEFVTITIAMQYHDALRRNHETTATDSTDETGVSNETGEIGLVTNVSGAPHGNFGAASIRRSAGSPIDKGGVCTAQLRRRLTAMPAFLRRSASPSSLPARFARRSAAPESHATYRVPRDS